MIIPLFSQGKFYALRDVISVLGKPNGSIPTDGGIFVPIVSRDEFNAFREAVFSLQIEYVKQIKLRIVGFARWLGWCRIQSRI